MALKKILVLIFSLLPIYRNFASAETFGINTKPIASIASLNHDFLFTPVVKSFAEAGIGFLNRILECERLEILNGISIVRSKQESNNTILKVHNPYLSLEEKLINMILTVSQKYSLTMRLKKLIMTDCDSEGRNHRRKNHLMPFMVFGIIGLSIILIPMGFKFLTILGGKALLLAKMALILSSIQGLKKLATSNYNYGLYQTSPVHPWNYDRYGYDDYQADLHVPPYIAKRS